MKNVLLDNAILFAVERHSGQTRKGSSTPYITHPMETLSILTFMKADLNLMIAGVLHDTLEDTDTTADELLQLFGSDITSLVVAHTEDKTKTWQERKQHCIDELSHADKRLKMLVLADKTANLRSLYADYKQSGENIWKHFNAPKEQQAWFYSQLIDAFYDLQFDPDTETIYWELNGLFKALFVSFYTDETASLLYQIGLDGTAYKLEKDKPQWIPVENDITIPLHQISRLTAERMEDNWAEEFRQVRLQDFNDAAYKLCQNANRIATLRLTDKVARLEVNDIGEECRTMTGTDHFDFCFALNEENTIHLLTQLRLKYGIGIHFSEMLLEAFGGNDCPLLFRNFCDQLSIEYDIYSM